MLHLRIATSESYLDRNKVRQERTEWHRVSLWGNRAEALGKILAKGERVLVEGRLQTRSYDDKDGRKVYQTEVVATNVVLCGERMNGRPGGRPAAEETGSAYPADDSQPWAEQF